LREKSEEFVLKPHLSGELTIGLSVWRCHLLSFSNPLQFWEKHTMEYPIMSETARRCASLPVRHNLKETFHPLDIL